MEVAVSSARHTSLQPARQLGQFQPRDMRAGHLPAWLGHENVPGKMPAVYTWEARHCAECSEVVAGGENEFHLFHTLQSSLKIFRTISFCILRIRTIE